MTCAVSVVDTWNEPLFLKKLMDAVTPLSFNMPLDPVDTFWRLTNPDTALPMLKVIPHAETALDLLWLSLATAQANWGPESRMQKIWCTITSTLGQDMLEAYQALTFRSRHRIRMPVPTKKLHTSQALSCALKCHAAGQSP